MHAFRVLSGCIRMLCKWCVCWCGVWDGDLRVESMSCAANEATHSRSWWMGPPRLLSMLAESILCARIQVAWLIHRANGKLFCIFNLIRVKWQAKQWWWIQRVSECDLAHWLWTCTAKVIVEFEERNEGDTYLKNSKIVCNWIWELSCVKDATRRSRVLWIFILVSAAIAYQSASHAHTHTTATRTK